MIPSHKYAKIAQEAVHAFIGQRKRLIPTSEELFGIKRACFVSLHNADGSLRGCIGTLEPRTDDLFYEIVQNAISAATHDPRFEPVTRDELEQLHISIDVLSDPEPTSPELLNPKKYGVIVTDGIRKGVLLPNLEGIDTVDAQIEIAKRKAGLNHLHNSKLTFMRFESIRYE